MELSLAEDLDVVSACRKADASGATYCNWRKKSGGVSKSALVEKKALEKENASTPETVLSSGCDRNTATISGAWTSCMTS